MTETEREKISAVRVTNFPPDIEGEDVLQFFIKNVDKGISLENLSISKDDRSCQVTINPRENKNVLFKVADILDYKKTR